MTVASDRRWVSFVVGREALLLWFCLLGSWLFLNHGLLYLQPRAEVMTAPPQAYILTTAVIYLFIRGVSLVAETRIPIVAGGTGRRGEALAPPPVRPVRRVVAIPDVAGDREPRAILRNAVASAQTVLPTRGEPGPTPLSALPDAHQGEAPVPRFVKEPWRPSWMADRPPRR